MARLCMRRRLDLMKSLREMAPIVPARAAWSIESTYQREKRHVIYTSTMHHEILVLFYFVSY